MRKFGVEIELNSFDQRDFKKNPLGVNELPLGIEYISNLLLKNKQTVLINDWHQTHNNLSWVCKPDSSCGIELCSPICDDLDPIVSVINLLSSDKNIKVDKRCSFHVHFNVEDCSDRDLISILSWWIKCESVFFDSFPDHRKLNKYCQPIGLSDIFTSTEEVNYNVIRKLGKSKYYSCNSYYFIKGIRPTIEFRMADEEACTNFEYANNWIILLSNFIDCCIAKGPPSSYCWIDLFEVFDFIKFDLKKWFINRILKNINSDKIYWNSKMRISTINLIEQMKLDKDF